MRNERTAAHGIRKFAPHERPCGEIIAVERNVSAAAAIPRIARSASARPHPPTQAIAGTPSRGARVKTLSRHCAYLPASLLFPPGGARGFGEPSVLRKPQLNPFSILAKWI